MDQDATWCGGRGRRHRVRWGPRRGSERIRGHFRHIAAMSHEISLTVVANAGQLPGFSAAPCMYNQRSDGWVRPSSFNGKEHSSRQLFGPCLLWPKRSPISATAELLLKFLRRQTWQWTNPFIENSLPQQKNSRILTNFPKLKKFVKIRTKIR